MTTRIYYFSATGNCLAVSRQIAARIGADTVSIAKLDSTARIRLEHERIGIVFPAYLTPVIGLPLIVERFIHNVDWTKSVRVFAVCTCGGYEFANALAPLERLRTLIRSSGGNLSEEYSVRMPMNNLDYAHIPVPISSDIPKIIENARNKTDQISERITQGKGTKCAPLKWLSRHLIALIYGMFRENVMKVLREKAKENQSKNSGADYYLPLTDRSIRVLKNCTGCGTCAQVCPAKNIVIRDGKPEFQHRCEMCFACDEWCPSGAIQHWSRGEGIKYHYPTVHLSDMR